MAIVRLYGLFAISVLFATPAAADLYKWTDERGVIHYSDRRPIEATPATKVESVSNRISVYSADPALLQAVEAARTRRGQPETASVPYRAPAYAAPVPAPALTNETCEFADCAVSGVPYPYPGAFVRRHPHNLVQAVLPPGAIAGTINSNGAIPGNTAGTNSVPAGAFRAGPRMKPLQSRQFPDPQRR